MSGRKNKYKQRGQQRGQSTDLLDELNSLRDLLGSDDIGDIPLLDQVASPGSPQRPAAPPITPRPPVRAPLDELDLPILFSPVDEELSEDFTAELNESDLKLLRPLQDLPAAPQDSKPAAAKDHAPAPRREQQRELFEQPAPVTENPFLPAHIRARLTGGRVPRAEEPLPEPAAAPARVDVSLIPEEVLVPEPEPAPPNAAAPAPTDACRQASAKKAADPAAILMSGGEDERRQLVDRLVAKQLPELERQLRARIEQMLDELEARR
ncbi:hypothetical protein [Microbulbifer magnicolonia]|uniref:hypothetical protein n=1 Tax=Microbulbifer magnicolonia TaxID=3109744 RepID=UPI002B40A2FC|nr:hypothetical protein [Microbulbifer sp. GG15]